MGAEQDEEIPELVPVEASNGKTEKPKKKKKLAKEQAKEQAKEHAE